jgi:hypothetical protein
MKTQSIRVPDVGEVWCFNNASGDLVSIYIDKDGFFHKLCDNAAAFGVSGCTPADMDIFGSLEGHAPPLPSIEECTIFATYPEWVLFRAESIIAMLDKAMVYVIKREAHLNRVGPMYSHRDLEWGRIAVERQLNKEQP